MIAFDDENLITKTVTCPNCRGTGRVPLQNSSCPGHNSSNGQVCHACQGEGYLTVISVKKNENKESDNKA